MPLKWPLFFVAIIFLTAFESVAADIKLKFAGTNDYPFSYPVNLSRAATVSTDQGATQTLPGGSSNIFVPRGVDGITFSFDYDEALLSIDLTWSAAKMSTALAKISEIELDGFEALQSVKLGANSLTWYVQGEVPAGCNVDYGQQTPLNFEVGIGNKINLGRYGSSDWKAVWTDSDSGTAIPDSYFTVAGDGIVSFGLNLPNAVQLSLSHPSGLTLSSYPIKLNKFLYPILSFTTDGRATRSDIQISSSQYVDGPLIIGYNGEYLESEVWNVALNLPNLVNSSEEIRLSANRPEIINRLDLHSLGIKSLSFEECLTEVAEIDLTDNSLLLSELPLELRQIPKVTLGAQKPFNLSPGPTPYSFDLSKEIEAGGTVQWLDDDGNPLDESCFILEDGVYTFIQPLGSASAAITSTSFPDYTISSYPVTVDFDYSPLAVFSWSSTSYIPTIISITSSADVYCRLDGQDYALKEGEPMYLRLSSSSGGTTLYTTDNSKIVAMDLSDIGLNALTLTGADNLASLILSGHTFTPHNIPSGIPAACRIEWGEPNEVTIETTEEELPGVDMIEYIDNYRINWYYLEDERPVEPEKFTERTGYFRFSEELGQIYALLSSKTYPSFVFRTTPVDISKPRSALTDIDASPAYRLHGGTLQLAEGISARIFDLKGACIKEIEKGGAFTLPQGVSIIRFSDGSTLKIMF